MPSLSFEIIGKTVPHPKPEVLKISAKTTERRKMKEAQPDGR